MPESKTSSNIDEFELAKFEALASRWWDANSEFKALHDINPLRANWIDRISPVVDKSFLDVGCGGGILAEAMAHRGASVTGIDMGLMPLEIARLHSVESNIDIDYQRITAEQLADKQPNSFDIVTCMEMLEHVPDPASTIEACARLARPGGNLYFSTINRNPKSFLFAIVGGEYILNMLPKGTHSYSRLIRPSELANWIRTAGLEVNHISGMVYNPFTQKYRLHPSDVSINYLVHASKPS
jgi:2-polyprenyl-6-hydroxyphenyl methylase/3-demethylubiquinone-9 3-methyltransferase